MGFTEQEIEAAAKAVCKSRHSHHVPRDFWADLDEFERGQYRDDARAVLAAVTESRTVTDVAGLDALPEGSVVLDELGIALRKTLVGWFADTGGNRMSSEYLFAHSTSITVLHYGEGAGK